MNKRILSLNFLFLLAASGPAFAGTNYLVRTATNVQEIIDNTGRDDTLVVEAAAYSGPLVFSKPITVLRSGTNQLVQFLGNVQITGTGALNFAQCEFVSNVQIQCSGATVSFAQCHTI